jgi:hypothetical protein
MTCQLWKEAYCHSGEVMEDLLFSSTESNIDIGDNNDDDDKIRGALHSNSVKCDNDHIDIQTKGEGPSEDVSFKWHPFGAFDVNKGYMVSVCGNHRYAAYYTATLLSTKQLRSLRIIVI